MAPRGPKPKPTQFHVLHGTFDKNPQRSRDDEPVAPAGVPDCPDHLDELAQQEWKRVSQLLAEMNILTLADRAALELYCHSYSEWRKACVQVGKYGAVLIQKHGDKIDARRNPFDIVRERNAKACERLLAEFGLTPSSRSRVHATKKTSGVTCRRRA